MKLVRNENGKYELEERKEMSKKDIEKKLELELLFKDAVLWLNNNLESEFKKMLKSNDKNKFKSVLAQTIKSLKTVEKAVNELY